MVKRLASLNAHELAFRDHLAPEPQLWEDGIRTDASAGTFEWWYFDSQFSDGSTAVIIFYTKPLEKRGGPLLPLVEMTITYPDPKNPKNMLILMPSQKFSPDQFKASKERCDIKIGPNTVHGDLHTYELHVEFQDAKADLVFTATSKSWRPDIYKQYTDDQLQGNVGWFPSVPAASVSGTLTYAGQTHTVTGDGYHDHNWGNRAMNSIVARWLWGRAKVGPYDMVFANIQTRKSFTNKLVPVLLLAQGDQFLTDNGYPLVVNATDYKSDPVGRTYPTCLDLVWQSDGGKITAQMRDARIIESVTLLGDYPKWLQWLINLVYKPWYFRFQSEIALTIDLPQTKFSQTGKVIYELMLLD